jgi:hypothetical protein
MVLSNEFRAQHDSLLTCNSTKTEFYAPTILQRRQAAVDEIRWDEKAGLRTGCGVRSQVIDVLEAQIKETGDEEG